MNSRELILLGHPFNYVGKKTINLTDVGSGMFKKHIRVILYVNAFRMKSKINYIGAIYM